MKNTAKNSRSPRNAGSLTSLSALALAVIGAFCGASTAWAVPFLGTAQQFAVLGASTVTNTGPTTIWGDVGLYPGPSIVGFASPPANTVVEGPGSTGLVNGPGLVAGTIYISDPVAQQARLDALTAYTTLAGLGFPGANDLTGVDLGTVGTLQPGVYHFDTSAQLTGTLTLDFGNDPDALFVFQIGSTLTTATDSVVKVLNGGTNDGVYWQVGTSAKLDTRTLFAGNIIADQSVTLITEAKILCGRAIALNAAVTMDTNTLSYDCFADTITDDDYGSKGYSGGFGTGGTLPGGGGTVPEPATLALLGLGLAGLGLSRRRNN